MGAPSIQEIVGRVERAQDWNDRIEEIRRVPEIFGQRQRGEVYAAIAEAIYRPQLTAQFAYVQWRDDYEFEPFEQTYHEAHVRTSGFKYVSPEHLAQVFMEVPETVRIFRTIVGYTPGELAGASSEVAKALDLKPVGKGQISSMERGSRPKQTVARVIAEAIHRLVAGTMWEVATGDFRSKIDKPDTREGWETVQEMARTGVPYSVLLHQRHYGGAFRTLLDATGTTRGEALLEAPVEELFQGVRVPYIRTGAHNQREIEERFGLTVRPAPDFIVYEGERTLRAMIECKEANDGGTARDKASRFGTLRMEAARLGGVPVFAVLDGLGWERTGDALGPVVRDTDGRVFSVKTLPEILTVHPFPGLAGA